MSPLLLALAMAAAPARAQTAGLLSRGDIEINVRVTGNVAAEGVFRLKSAIEGRVERVLVGTHTWVGPERLLGVMASRELSAILDAHGSQGDDVLEERWQKMYRPTKIRCPGDCYILKVFIKPKQPVKPQAVLFEAAKSLKLLGRVRLEDAARVRYGQEFEFWPVKDPSRRLRARVEHYQLDAKGLKGPPGATFELSLSPGMTLAPGTEWEGVIAAEVKRRALRVPTAALIRHENSLYLPVKVSTGVTTAEATEIVGGVEEGRPYLLLDPSQVGAAARHKFELDPGALERRLEEERKAAAPPQKPKKAPPEEPPRDPSLGSDPYEE